MLESNSVKDGSEGRSSGGVFWILAQMFIVPFRTFMYGMEMLLDSMRSMQTIGDRSMRAMFGADGEPRGPAAPQVPEPVPPALVPPQVLYAQSEISIQRNPAPIPQAAPPPTDLVAGATSSGEHSETKKEIRQMDTDLQDDDLKLVRYKVLFVKRDYETAFPEREELVYDNITGESFTAWKVGEFIQSLRNGGVKFSGKLDKYKHVMRRHPHKEERPHELTEEHLRTLSEAERKEAKEDWDQWHREAEYWLTNLEEGDKKYLRVYYEVLQRYPREKLHYEEDHLSVLREINQAVSRMADKKG